VRTAIVSAEDVARTDALGPKAVEAREQPDGVRPKLSRAERLSRERERLLLALASGKTTSLQERVAWILSRKPPTRDSDVRLQIAYWQEFEEETYLEFKDEPELRYARLTRLTAIARSRAKIQNQHRLFLASEAIRKRRGQLSEEERERHANDIPPSPVINVYVDESGKTGKRLIVGSAWFLDPTDTLRLPIKAQEWRRTTGFEEEFHFSDLTRDSLPYYLGFIEMVMNETPLLGFKSISVPREGFRDFDAPFDVLYYELLRQGVAHEHGSGRAPLPRQLMVWKDEEAEGRGRDQVIVSKLRDRLVAASGVHFRGALQVELCEAINSKGQPLLQLADLYTGSLNRISNRERSTEHPKDRFADFLLDRVGSLGLAEHAERINFGEDGDSEVSLAL
jgi:hypothetical protein